MNNESPDSTLIDPAEPDNCTAADSPIAPLSARLKAHTQAVHRRAERSGIIHAILTGTVSRAAYTRYLRNLHPVYVQLEARLQQHRISGLSAALSDPGLFRANKLRHDLEQIAGEHWSDSLPHQAGSRSYAARVANATDTQLVAHAYVRYLGDLNGGQVLQKILARTLGFEANELSFYRFPELTNLNQAISEFRQALDTFGMDNDCSTILLEAQYAFELNMLVAEESMDHG